MVKEGEVGEEKRKVKLNEEEGDQKRRNEGQRRRREKWRRNKS